VKPLRGLLVDVGNVLVDERTWPPLTSATFRNAWGSRLSEEFGGIHAWFGGLAATDVDRAIEAITDSAVDGPGGAQGTRAILAQHFDRHGLALTDGAFSLICDALAVPLQGIVAPEADAYAALALADELGLRMVVCSNTAVRRGDHYRRDFADWGLAQFFGAYVTSLDVGFRKPHPAMFEAGLAALGTSPEETAMIGDRPERDILGAHALGIRTIWRRPPGFEGPCTPTPDAEISRLSELEPIFRAWVQPNSAE